MSVRDLPQPDQEIFRKTRDGIRIAANLFKARRKTNRLLILSPGFAKKKDAYPMREICSYLTRYGDVLGMDLRGVGKSEGRYTFGAEEYQDLEPYLKWARKHYKKTILIGLSLGSYHSLRAAHMWPHLVDKALLVSCPNQLEDVLKTLGPLRQGWAIVTDLKALKRRLSAGADPFFRWGNPFSAKPKAEWLAPTLSVPVAFLVGGKDRLVVKELSRRVYEGASKKKSWTEIPEGNHAEFLYLENQPKFKAWIHRQLAQGTI